MANRFRENWVRGLMAVGLAGCAASAQVSANTPSEEPVEPEVVDVAQPAEDPPDVHVEGDHLTIDQKIHFGRDSDEIMADSFELLDHIAQALVNHAELAKVQVIGHTDSTGADGHNKELSSRRAAAVADALKERGAKQEFDTRGAGETEPACQEETPECHEKNRRVEFVVEQGAP